MPYSPGFQVTNAHVAPRSTARTGYADSPESALALACELFVLMETDVAVNEYDESTQTYEPFAALRRADQQEGP